MLTQPGKMIVAAHRGDSYNEMENTLGAFYAAIESGAEMIETDVRLTKDGVPVLMHDNSVDRTTDGHGLVAEMTFEQVRGLHVDGSCAFVPTLEELLKLVEETSFMKLNIELKVYSYIEGEEACKQCIDLCVDLVERYGLGERVVFNSFDAYALEYIADRYQGKYPLHGFYPYSAMKNVRRNPDEYLYCACIWGKNDPAHYQHLLSHGIEPWIGAGITQACRLEECFKLGARLVTTNFPHDIVQKLRRMGAL